MGLFGSSRSYQNFRSVQKFILLKRKTKKTEDGKETRPAGEPFSKRRKLEKEYKSIVSFAEEDQRIRRAERREISEKVKELEIKLEDLRRQKRDLFRQVKEMKNEEERRKMQDWEERMRTEYMLANQQYQRSLSQQQELQNSDLDLRSSVAKSGKDGGTASHQASPAMGDPRVSTTTQNWSELNSLDPRLHAMREEQKTKLTLPLVVEQSRPSSLQMSSEAVRLVSPPVQGGQDGSQSAAVGNRDNQPPPLMSPVAMRPPPEMQALSNFSPPGPPQGMIDVTRPPLLGFRPPRLGSTHALITGDTVPPPLIPPPINQFPAQVNQGLARPPFIVGEQYWGPSQIAHPQYVQRHSSTGSSGSSPVGSPKMANFAVFPKTQ